MTYRASHLPASVSTASAPGSPHLARAAPPRTGDRSEARDVGEGAGAARRDALAEACAALQGHVADGAVDDPEGMITERLLRLIDA